MIFYFFMLKSNCIINLFSISNNLLKAMIISLLLIFLILLSIIKRCPPGTPLSYYDNVLFLVKNNPPIPPATKRIPKGINEFISNLLPVLTISIFLFVRLHVIISP